MYNFTPPKNNKYAELITLSLFAGALVLFLIGSKTEYKMPFQLCGVFMTVFTVLFASRYLLCSHSYLVDRGAFIVYKNSGKKNEKVCDLDLSAGARLVKASAVKSGKQKIEGKLFNYCNELFPREAYFLIVKFGEGNITLKIQADSGLIGAFADENVEMA